MLCRSTIMSKKEKHEAALHDLESQITQRQSDMLDAGKRQIKHWCGRLECREACFTD